VQLEPVWGGSADAAVELRGICAAGLARTNYPQVTWELAHLLADPDPSARMAAARAVAHAGRDEGAALLAMKIRLGDKEPAVTAECLAALLRLAPAKGVDVAAGYLDHPDDELRMAALMALGESRRPEALKLLKQRYEAELNVAKRGPLLLPIALTRQPDAIEFLIAIVDEERPAAAAEAVAALATFRGDDTVRARVEGIVNDRNEADLRAAFEKHFVRSR
jgi:HEAT repeat protein